GHRLLVWNRTPGRDAGAVSRGAERARGPAELLAAADLTILMLPDLFALRELVDGPAHLLSQVQAHSTLVIGSTVSPKEVRECAESLHDDSAGLLSVVDAPVSGGPEGAREGSLSIMAGGTDEDFERARPALNAMGSTVRHV